METSFGTAQKGHLVKANAILQLSYECPDEWQFFSLKARVDSQSQDEALCMRGETSLWRSRLQRTR